jgi:hypothetical protein
MEVGAGLGRFRGFGSKAKKIVGWNRLSEIGFPSGKEAMSWLAGFSH